VFLAAHFALWNASLGLTSVGAATTLVSSAPLFVAWVGVPRRAAGAAGLAGIVLATVGAVVIGAGDAAGFGAGPDALAGDVLAFAGALAMAAYLLLGRVARRRLPVSTYAASVYGVAAAVLLPACLLTSSDLAGYPAASWLPWPGWSSAPSCSATPSSTACWPRSAPRSWPWSCCSSR
jgi:drug/metabolite transporter (DMT)-like permease